MENTSPCNVFRKPQTITLLDAYPLPCIDDIIREIAKYGVYNTLDHKAENTKHISVLEGILDNQTSQHEGVFVFSQVIMRDFEVFCWKVKFESSLGLYSY